MNKLKLFPSATLLIILPVFAIFSIIAVSNGAPSKPQMLNTKQTLYCDTYCQYDPINHPPSEIWSRPFPPAPSDIYQIGNNTKTIQENIELTNKFNKEKEMNENAIVALSWVSVISILVICVYAYFRRRHIDDHKFAEAKEERLFNLKVKELELNQTLQLQQAELERYKTLELSKTQIDNEHEVALKKIEFDKSIDARDFMLTVTKDEREFLLKQRELDIKEGKSSPSFMDVLDSNKDVQLRLKK